jgi:hypothetical protein
MADLQCFGKDDDGPVPVVAADFNGVKLYGVTITADVQISLAGCVQRYATSDVEAAAKVQKQIDAETLDDGLEFEDAYSGNIMQYHELKGYHDLDVQIDESEIDVVESEVDPLDVLAVEVQELRNTVSWNGENLAKQKVFLQSLL